MQVCKTLIKLLSLSFWENEEAIEKWRNNIKHRKGQAAGFDHIFNDYHIRVGNIVRDYGMNDRIQAPDDSNEYIN